MKGIQERISEQFRKELNEIKGLRRAGIDKKVGKEISTRRLTDGIIRLPEWQIMKSKLIKEPRRRELQ